MARGILRLYYTRKHLLDVDKHLTRTSKFHTQCSRYQKYLSQKRFSSQAAETETAKGVAYNELSIGIPKEIWQNEKRVAITPAVAQTLIKKGFNINIEENAGVNAKFRNQDFEAAGAVIVDNKKAFESDIILKVRQPLDNEVSNFKENSTLISFLYPSQNKILVDKLAERRINAFGKYKVSFIVILFSTCNVYLNR